MAVDEISCPFCGFKKTDEYAIQLHIEEHHTEDSPFNIINAVPDLPVQRTAKPNASTETQWIKCTRSGCGEFMSVAEMQEHLDLHEAIEASEHDVSGDEPRAGRRSSTRNRSPNIAQHSSRKDRDSPDAREVHRDSGRSQPRNRWEGRLDGPSQRSPASPSSGSGSSRSLLEYFSTSSTRGRPPLPPRPPRRIEQPRQPGRLGTKELGPHAFEASMPAEVRRRLLHDALPRQSNRIGRDGRVVKETFIENETAGLIPVLADLCARNRSTAATYFCHPAVRHVHKIRCEGNFCGYWNIQMTLSFLARDASDGDLVPDVLAIQDTIEQAWDNGICTYSRVETGGIRGTRKWIGTHDALAYFTQADVRVQALSFQDEVDEQPAVLSLLDHLEAYFIGGLERAESRGTSSITDLAPVYFQRAGHSMTIVGLERKTDGGRNLILFDPSFGTTRAMDRVLDGGGRVGADPHALLRPYRRSDESLSRWKEFEILMPQGKG